MIFDISTLMTYIAILASSLALWLLPRHTWFRRYVVAHMGIYILMLLFDLAYIYGGLDLKSWSSYRRISARCALCITECVLLIAILRERKRQQSRSS